MAILRILTLKGLCPGTNVRYHFTMPGFKHTTNRGSVLDSKIKATQKRGVPKLLYLDNRSLQQPHDLFHRSASSSRQILFPSLDFAGKLTFLVGQKLGCRSVTLDCRSLDPFHSDGRKDSSLDFYRVTGGTSSSEVNARQGVVTAHSAGIVLEHVESPENIGDNWWRQLDSNQRPTDYEN